MRTISVIVPAFNAEKTLPETLHSIAAQTRPADEIIVVDDGSTDATAGIAAATPGVRLIRQQNSGVGSALNAGLAAANGSFIALLDADDIWVPACLDIHLSNLDQFPQLDASVGWSSEFVCPSLSPATSARFQPRPAQAGWLGGASLFSREAYQRAGEFNPTLRGGTWLDWVDRARRANVSFGVINELVLQRRLHPGTLSTSPETKGGLALTAAVRLAIARRREAKT